MWIWPVWYIGGDRSFKHSVSLDEDLYPHLIDYNRTTGYRPTVFLRERLDDLVGAGKWAFQNRSANSEQTEMLTLWFTTKEDKILVSLWLPIDGEDQRSL